MALVDDVVARRNAFTKLEDQAVAQMQGALDELRTIAEQAVEDLKGYTNEDGELVKDADAVRFANARVQGLKDALDRITAKANTKLQEAKRNAYERGAAEAQYTAEKAIGGNMDLVPKGSFDQVPVDAAKKAAQKPVLGVKPNKAFDRASKYTQERLQEALVGGVLAGDDVDTVARKVNEALQGNEAAAQRITRTNLTASFNEAHKDFIDENDDVFDGYVWDSTLDNVTSAICAKLHGRVFRDGEVPPGPPAHWNCRSVLLPHFKDPAAQDFADGGSKRVRNLRKDGERAKTTTVVSNDTSFEDWLIKQPPEATKRITGSLLKDTLWRNGSIEFDEIVAPDLTTRTDEEIVQRAVTHDPTDSDLKALAKEYGVKPTSDAALERADRRLENKQSFDLGTSIEDAKAELKTALAQAREDVKRAKAEAKRKVEEKKRKEKK